MRVVCAAALSLVVLTGCSKKPDDKVTYVKKDDQAMNAAMAKARSSVNKFIAVLKSPKPGQSDFSVKVPFVQADSTEHMWLTSVSYDGKVFTGTVNNEPQMVNNVKLGDRTTIAPSKISDWMYVENGKLVGGETLRVLRNRLPANERAEFDKQVGFVID